MNENILSILEEKASAFSKGQKRIAGYILSDLQKAAFLTAGALGKETEVSESTVVRFATELGFSGFPQMQKALQRALVDRFGGGVAAPKDLQEEAIAGAAQILSSARRIYLIALGEDKLLSEYMGYSLEKYFPDVHTICANSGKLKFAGAEDAAIVFSFSSFNREAEVMAAACHSAGVKIIGVTDSERSPICVSCHCCLFAKPEQTPWGSSLARPISLIERLLSALIPGEKGEGSNET